MRLLPPIATTARFMNVLFLERRKARDTEAPGFSIGSYMVSAITAFWT